LPHTAPKKMDRTKIPSLHAALKRVVGDSLLERDAVTNSRRAYNKNL